MYTVWHCLPSSIIQKVILQLEFCHFQVSDICWNLFGLWFLFFFKMAFRWESLIESGPNMSWLSLYSWGAGLVSMQVSLVLCVGVSDKPALPAKGQHLCLCWLTVTSMASCQRSDFFYLALPEHRRWGYCCRIFTFTAISRWHYPEWVREMLCSFSQKHTIH